MAYIRLNPSNLHMDVLVGVLETYSPTEEVKQAFEESEVLKKQTQEFLNKYWSNKTNAELQKIFSKSENERKLWEEYLTNEYNPKIQALLEKVEELNKKLTTSS